MIATFNILAHYLHLLAQHNPWGFIFLLVMLCWLMLALSEGVFDGK
jgi:hypothetical protein